jgi:transcriptional regulator with PAS, ATPase and Fis domain
MISQQQIQDIKNRFEIVGNSVYLNRAIEKAIKVAPTDISVLITGESGVGKEAFSKIIHHISRRKHGPFIAINCAAIPEGTIDSELFGHEKGSFTSAYEARKGYFETVNGGSIFLDEISELPLETQSRLLRVLETGEFIKVGSSKVQKTDVRIIAASNKDLLELTQKNKFREDLFYRLTTVTIQIPPLRKRKEDIVYLFAKFANDFADKYKSPPIELTPEALENLQNHYWQGNIRQLKNVVEQISILETERLITGDMIKNALPETTSKELIPVENSRFGSNEGFQERELIYKFLFDIKKDLSELKSMMYQMAQHSDISSGGIKEEEFSNQRLLKPGNIFTDHTIPTQPIDVNQNTNVYFEEHTEIKELPENLSLQEKEKEMIKEALLKHKGRRKPASKELGISERTLYRKIKEYELEYL